MKWVTREYVHLDRVAAPWLISRFVDPDARFCYVPWGRESLAPPDAIPLAMPGAELGPHDETSSTFEKVLKKYGLNDPALSRLARIIRAGIDYVLHDYRPDAGDHDGQIAVGILAIAEGLLITNDDDDRILQASFATYDALYAFLRVEEEIARAKIPISRTGDDGRGPSSLIEAMRDIHERLPSAPAYAIEAEI